MQDGIDREPTTLPNGMRVQYLSYPQAKHVLLMLLVASGERDDPPAWPGMAHYLEHLALTAGAGDEPGRDYATLNQDYRMVNGQTMWDHVCHYWIFDAQRLDEELGLLATRLDDLRITPSDLEREIPRLELELGNMYSVWPNFAPPNYLQTVMRRGLHGPRRGGEIDRLRDLDAETLLQRWGAVTHPENLILVIAGGFEKDEIQAEVSKQFGERKGATENPPKRMQAGLHQGEAVHLEAESATGKVALAGFHPPGDKPEELADFAAVAFAIMLNRSAVARAQFLLLEDPHILMFTLQEEAEDPEARLQEWLTEMRAGQFPKLTYSSVKRGMQNFRPVVPPMQLATLANHPDALYTAAYSAATRALRGDPDFWKAYDKRMAGLTAESLTAAVESALSEERALYLTLKPTAKQN